MSFSFLRMSGRDGWRLFFPWNSSFRLRELFPMAGCAWRCFYGHAAFLCAQPGIPLKTREEASRKRPDRGKGAGETPVPASCRQGRTAGPCVKGQEKAGKRKWRRAERMPAMRLRRKSRFFVKMQRGAFRVLCGKEHVTDGGDTAFLRHDEAFFVA